MDHTQVKSMKLVLLLSSLAAMGIFAYAAYVENFRGKWRGAQHQYRALLLEQADGDTAIRAAHSFSIGHKQLYLPRLSTVDRCTTCHLGVENPQMANAPAPLTRHPGDLLAHHPAERFGCTVCHQGQGRAVTQAQAHGWHDDGRPVAHAESPLLRGDAVYTRCSLCHYEFDLFGGTSDLHAASVAPAIDGEQLSRALPQADRVAEGKALVVSSGCLGCHTYRGRGGVLGPDITYVGDKTRHDFAFAHIRGEHTVEQWLFEHFMYPAEVAPGTVMPDMGYTEDQAQALTHYMMSLHRKTAPASHRPPPPPTAVDGAVRGETLYAMFCAACHGPEGYGSTMRTGLWPVDADPWGHNWDARNIVTQQANDMTVLVPSLNHPDTLAVASESYLRSVIAHGRPGTPMIGWRDEGGLTEDELTLLVAAIQRWRPRGAEATEISAAHGEPRVGQALYRANCAACHGRNGEGGLAVSLNGPTFLAVASDQFLADTIVHGRPDTAMPAWKAFNAQEISDLLAFMRHRWQPARSDLHTAERLCRQAPTPEVSADIGRILYKANCVMCHGSAGQGDLGPSLNTQQFLSVVPDAYLLTTMIEGRPGTAMPAWKQLSNEDVASLVTYLRTWQTVPGRTVEWHAEPVVRGDPQLGRMHFVGHCSGCHGLNAQGASGPQIGHPVFLKTATDRMLKEWITHGKEGTEMRPFRKGGHGIVELSERYIEDVIAYLRSLEYDGMQRIGKSPHGRPQNGRLLYATHCVGCHGSRGEGSSGPALSNPHFLRFASDGYLLATMALGRSGTEMRPVKSGPQSILGLTSDEVNDVLAYIRSWEHDSPFNTPAGPVIPHRFVIPWDLQAGKTLYTSHCSGCHGTHGRGNWAPELNNEGFLASATDGFLQATIVTGRRGTAMRSFGTGSHGLVDLTADDVDNIVAYMRSWSTSTPSPMTLPAERSVEHNRVESSTESEHSQTHPSKAHPPVASIHLLPKERSDD